MADSYIVFYYRVPKPIRDAFERIVGHHNQETQHFYAQVYIGQRLNPDKMVPICKDLIRKTWGNKVRWLQLYEEGILKVKAFNKEKHLSNEFSLTDEYFEILNDAWPTNSKDYVNIEGYNLITGRLMRPKGHVLNTEKKAKLPLLIRDAMLAIKPCLFNDLTVQAYFNFRWPGGLKAILCERERACYYVDRFALDAMRMSDLQETDIPGIYTYRPSYKVQYTGRITEVGRGLQSCSRQMKRAAFDGIKNLYNYDLESAQIWVLVQFFETANISTNWLTTYLATGKEPYYTSVGLDKSTWKDCLIALILGSTCPKTLDDKVAFGEEHESAIANYILDYYKGQTSLAQSSVKSFYDITTDLNRAMKLWYDWLIKHYIFLPGVAVKHKSKHFVNNSTGMQFCVSDYMEKGQFKNVSELKRRLAAFLLQGSEACFIHNLTLLQEQHGFKVINNQHDGLVTEGIIPAAAIEQAKQASGLKYATLVEKPFT